MNGFKYQIQELYHKICGFMVVMWKFWFMGIIADQEGFQCKLWKAWWLLDEVKNYFGDKMTSDWLKLIIFKVSIVFLYILKNMPRKIEA